MPRRDPSAPPSLADVARAAGVSTATVSRLVNGQTHRASAETARRVGEAVERLGYRPSPLARGLRRRESAFVALLAPNLDNPAMAAMAASIEAALRGAGLVTILCDTHDRPDLQDEHLAAMRAHAARGFVLVAAVASEGLGAALRRGDPIVFVNRRDPMGRGPYVGVDNRAAGAAAAEHLLGLGFDDLAALSPRAPSSTGADRLAGFRARAKKAGARLSLHKGEGGDHLAVGWAAAQAMLRARGWPQGLFCPSDLIAYAAGRAAREAGLSPAPGAIVGVDGNPLNPWLAPWLASVRVPYAEFGAAVTDALAERWSGARPRDRILPHDLAGAAVAR